VQRVHKDHRHTGGRGGGAGWGLESAGKLGGDDDGERTWSGWCWKLSTQKFPSKKKRFVKRRSKKSSRFGRGEVAEKKIEERRSRPGPGF